MIDLHTHILPDLDDGAEDWNESLEMCEIAARDGIHTIVATPHIKPGVYASEKALIVSKVNELNQRLISHEFLVHSPESNTPPDPPLPTLDLIVLPGADIYFQPDILQQIKDGTALFLGEHGNPTNVSRLPRSSNVRGEMPERLSNRDPVRYLLLELPDYFLPLRVKDLIRELRSKNVVAILSHPERNMMFRNHSKLLHELIQAGALSQVTAMSITGEFGREIQKITKKWISKNLVHIIASDAHSRDRRPPVLSPAVAEVANSMGSDRAEMMVREIPQAVIEGREVET